MLRTVIALATFELAGLMLDSLEAFSVSHPSSGLTAHVYDLVIQERRPVASVVRFTPRHEC